MEILLLAIYSIFVWLIFFKLKLLPWTFVWQVVVVTIPIIGLTVLILLLNVVAPSSHDVRVINYVVQIVPQVSGQVVEVPVQNNQFVKRGEVLLRLDSVPYVLKVQQLEAELANTEGQIGQAREELAAAQGSTASLRAQLALSEKRVQQHQELVQAGAGNRFDLEGGTGRCRGHQGEDRRGHRRRGEGTEAAGCPRGRVPGRDRVDAGPAGAGPLGSESNDGPRPRGRLGHQRAGPTGHHGRDGAGQAGNDVRGEGAAGVHAVHPERAEQDQAAR